MGKTSMAIEARSLAQANGMTVVAIAGAQEERGLPFAGLHQILRPWLADLDGLPGTRRDALRAAFALSEVDEPEQFLTSLATWDLLTTASRHAPVALIVDDAHWLDPSSAHVLSFVARRASGHPLFVVVTAADGHDGASAFAGLRHIRLNPLDETASGALLDREAPRLQPSVRRRILAAAAGNPLGLVELGVEPGGGQRRSRGRRAGHPPADRSAGSIVRRSPRTAASMARSVAVIAALHAEGTVREFLKAATLVEERNVGPDAIEALVSSGLVRQTNAQLRFTSPLLRAAVHWLASTNDRRSAHAALAQVLHDRPDHRIWHLAAAAIGPDEAVATELDVLAGRLRRKGAMADGVAALQRAVEPAATRRAALTGSCGSPRCRFSWAICRRSSGSCAAPRS